MSSSPSGLQTLLNICTDYASCNDITYNSLKSSCMVFKPPRYKLTCPDININGNVMPYSESCKYLGVMLNSTGSDDDDIRKHLRCFYARSNTLLRKFHHCSTDIKLSLFKSYCLPSYCIHLWVNYTNAMYRKMKVAFNNVYRRILGVSRRDSASSMYVSNGIEDFDCFIRRNIYRFIMRLSACENELVNSVTKSSTFISNGMWQKWFSLLYVLHFCTFIFY